MNQSSNLKVDPKIDINIKKPHMYKIIMYNDHYTPQDFVTDLLMYIFDKDIDQATSIMLTIHNNGKANVGVYTYDIAVTKINQANEIIDNNSYPLTISMEKV